MFPRNTGALDRAVRLTVGIILLAVGLFLLGALGGSGLGIVSVAIGVVGVVTGATGFCPLYVPLGISKVKQERAAPSP